MQGIWRPSDPGSRLPDDLLEFLQSRGFVTSSLIEAALDGDDQDAAYELLASLEAPLIKSRVWSLALVAWMTQGGEAAAKRQRASRVVLPIDVRSEIVGAAQASRRIAVPSIISAVMNECVKTTVWKTRRQKQLGLAAGPQERADIERGERERWLEQVVSIIKEAVLPVVAFASLSTSPELALKHVAGVRKANTLRARVRAWSRVRLWLLMVFLTPWPQHVGQMMDYLFDLQAGGCSRTVPRSIFLALLFFETAGSVAKEDMISSNKLWTATVNDIEAQIVSRVGTEVRKAPPFFLSMLIALELYEVSNRPAFQRFLAWVRLVKV
jgi:hypothetical protein